MDKNDVVNSHEQRLTNHISLCFELSMFLILIWKLDLGDLKSISQHDVRKPVNRIHPTITFLSPTCFQAQYLSSADTPWQVASSLHDHIETYKCSDSHLHLRPIYSFQWSSHAGFALFGRWRTHTDTGELCLCIINVTKLELQHIWNCFSDMSKLLIDFVSNISNGTIMFTCWWLQWRFPKAVESSASVPKEKAYSIAAVLPVPCYNLSDAGLQGEEWLPFSKDEHSALHVAQQLTLLEQVLFYIDTSTAAFLKRTSRERLPC